MAFAVAAISKLLSTDATLKLKERCDEIFCQIRLPFTENKSVSIKIRTISAPSMSLNPFLVTYDVSVRVACT
jgi:hypothetical protein